LQVLTFAKPPNVTIFTFDFVKECLQLSLVQPKWPNKGNCTDMSRFF
jgi:hypothetical protein